MIVVEMENLKVGTAEWEEHVDDLHLAPETRTCPRDGCPNLSWNGAECGAHEKQVAQ